jgi:hypothetical protein
VALLRLQDGGIIDAHELKIQEGAWCCKKLSEGTTFEGFKIYFNF